MGRAWTQHAHIQRLHTRTMLMVPHARTRPLCAIACSGCMQHPGRGVAVVLKRKQLSQSSNDLSDPLLSCIHVHSRAYMRWYIKRFMNHKGLVHGTMHGMSLTSTSKWMMTRCWSGTGMSASAAIEGCELPA